MPVTPVYSLPYPTDSDAVDVAGDIQDLATAVETALSSSSGTGGWRNTFLLMGA